MGRCTVGFLKYLLILFNFVVFAAGIALVAISVYVIVDSSSFQELVNREGMLSLFTAVWLIFSIGIALFLLGLMGCYGSSKENRILLAIYFFLIFVVFVVEIIAAILAFVFYPEVAEVAIGSTQKYGLQMLPSFGNKTEDERMVSQDITKYWDSIQSTIKCCGYSSINDWDNGSFYNNTNQHYPPSCCSETNTFDGGFTTQLVMNQSCTFEKVQNFTGGVSCEGVAKSNFMVLSGVALGVLGVEFLAMFASCCMYRSLEEDY
jgi:hypothetical protein